VTAAVPVSSSEPLPAPGSRLSDEAHAVLAARAALRSGNPEAALRELSDARASFPRGALVQEREALTIEALARTGQSGAASARAQAFLHRFPRSPHGDDVRRFIVAR
jgi:outer membrane protein assembly factor BamD (BamD/ComL family)